MKKHILAIAFLGFSGFLSAQNFSITDASGLNVTGTTQYYWIDQNVQDSRHFTVANISANNIDVKVRRTIIQLNTPTAVTSFCTNINCYAPQTNITPQSVTMNASGGSFDLTADYTPDSLGGTGHVRYAILDQTNAADSVVFDIIYNSAPAGINAHILSKASISNPAPNPASSIFALNYKLGTANPDGAKMIIYNVLGDRVMETPVGETEGTVRMDVSGLDQGIYFCSLESDGKMLATRRLIVAH